jgi:serine/threonine protein kinase
VLAAGVPVRRGSSGTGCLPGGPRSLCIMRPLSVRAVVPSIETSDYPQRPSAKGARLRVVDANAQGRGFQAGHVIADKYELEALVGEGGMGSVWRARHRQLESAVALKLMSPAIASQPEALNRFLREARAAARLSSLHVVKVFDFGVDGDTPFIAMELLQGESLRERLDRTGALSPELTLWVMRQTARALSKAHAEGIVHRDLKPENLFITQQEDELLKVLDFGVAKLANASGQPTTSTRTGALLGTPFYMSPEQARGIKAVDHRSDIWSLGVIAFECITGRLPFDSEAFGDLVLKICTLPAPIPSSVAHVPAGFDTWFARITERDPERRYQSVEELVAGLQALVSPASDAGGPPPPLTPVAVANTERAPRTSPTRTDVTASQSLMAVLPSRGWAWRGWLLFALAALLGLGALLILVAREPEPSSSRPAASLDPAGSPEPARVPAASTAAADAPTSDIHSEGAGGTPAVHLAPDPENNVPGSTASSAGRVVPHAPAALRMRKPPAPTAPRVTPRSMPSSADPLPHAPRPDLFSDPD